jgi:hypothetical protein
MDLSHKLWCTTEDNFFHHYHHQYRQFDLHCNFLSASSSSSLIHCIMSYHKQYPRDPSPFFSTSLTHSIISYNSIHEILLLFHSLFPTKTSAETSTQCHRRIPLRFQSALHSSSQLFIILVFLARPHLAASSFNSKRVYL